MKKYTQLSLEERELVFEGLKRRMSQNEIAKLLRRDKSTISRELSRNSDSKGYYFYPQDAHAQSAKRKAQHGYKVERLPGLKEYVLEKLNAYWSPLAIAGRWSLEHPRNKITKEAIYAWIYGPSGKNLGLPKLLPRAKTKRGLGRPKKPRGKILDRISVHVRPEIANKRKELGHLEGDLMFNSGSQSSNILTLVDRKSRVIMLIKNQSKKADIVGKAVIQGAINLHAKTVTFDNGTEFTDHTKLNKNLGIATYFCDPGSPWQKGTVENMNKQIRRFLPFKYKAHEITQEIIDNVATILNNMPREILGFRTPLEVHKNIKRKTIISESRMKTAWPAAEAVNAKVYYEKQSSVALRL